MSTRKATMEINGADESIAARVVSRDGTEICYWTSGDGPPLVLIHGTAADHTTWRPLLPYLEPHVTVHSIDRRGRGGSSDGPDYAIWREFEDVAAVVDAVAEASGSTVNLFGHSLGGLCAFGGAALSPNVRRLVLYEGWPPLNPEALAFPPGIGERLDALMAEGNRQAVLETFLRKVVMMPDEVLSALRAQPAWQAYIAAAHTITREIRAIPDAAFDPQHAAKITVPTLMLVGRDSPDKIKADYETVAAELPDVRITVLDGQQHVAHQLIPQLFAELVVAFLREHP